METTFLKLQTVNCHQSMDQIPVPKEIIENKLFSNHFPFISSFKFKKVNLL